MPTGVYIRTEAHNRANAKAKLGRKLGPPSLETRRKLSIALLGRKCPLITGPNHYRWNGGKSSPASILNKKIWAKKRRDKAKEWLDSIKSQYSCAVCNESDIACLDFHHLDKSKKKKEISRMVFIWADKNMILDEIKKCQILCSNCHRKLHAREKNNKV